MNNFWRALRYTWPYRRRLYLSLACSLLVAILWGANLSAIYPALTVLLEGKTFATWMDDSQQHELKEIVKVKAQIERVNADVRVIEEERRVKPRAQLDAHLSERRGELARR